MNRYSIAPPRVASGLAAVAMTAITLALTVVLPASIYANRHATLALAATTGAPVRTETAPAPLRIDVVGEREEQSAFAPGGNPSPNQERRG